MNYQGRLAGACNGWSVVVRPLCFQLCLGALLLLWVSGSGVCWAAPAAVEVGEIQVRGVRIWPAPEHTRLVLDLSGPARFSYFSLSGPERLVLDLRATRLRTDLPVSNGQDLFLKRLRASPRGSRDLRIVLDLKRATRSKVFTLKPNARYGHRLVVDFHPPAETDVVLLPKPGGASPRKRSRDVLVAVDAGHGGEDPGAVGHGGSYEKDVILRIAQRLARKIDAERGMRAYLVRKGDYSLSLNKRRKLAREQGADLFISLHADSFRDKRVRGSTVYVLSSKGASSETARLLAQRENASDLIAGVNLEEKDELLYKVLLDLSLAATREAGYEAAEAILKELGKASPLHKSKVQWANFMVLRSPNIPSILVETGFISNPRDERNLGNPRHQALIAQMVFQGVKRYFQKRPPQGTFLAQRHFGVAEP